MVLFNNLPVLHVPATPVCHLLSTEAGFSFCGICISIYYLSLLLPLLKSMQIDLLIIFSVPFSVSCSGLVGIALVLDRRRKEIGYIIISIYIFHSASFIRFSIIMY